MIDKKDYEEMRNCVDDIINNNIGANKEYDSIQELVFELYKENLILQNKLEKHQQFLTLINQVSGSFNRLNFENIKFNGRWILEEK